MDKMNVLITGGNGYIAKSLYQSLNDQYNVTKITRTDFDLTDYWSTFKWFVDKKFDVVIHTAIVGGSRLKPDSDDTINQNLKMIFNLQQNKHSFKKLITFGSGAEIFQQNTPYGLSKRVISQIIENIENWYNLRIFGVFDHNELDTRFIKGNILRYLKREPMIIHSDKIMDFIYMKDLVEIVKYYIETSNPPKVINCSYPIKHTLKNIADFINTIDNHRVPVAIQYPKELEFYCGNDHELTIPQIGLHGGILNTFNEIVNLKRTLYDYSSDNI
jgi:nucleoside-diphosphate-sugar epimerase